MKREIPNVTFHEGLPSRHDLETWHSEKTGHKMLIFDDLMMEASISKEMVNIYCNYNFFCILVSQNAFSPGKKYCTISLNTHYFILFKNRRDESQIQRLGRQIFPRNLKYFMNSYEKATEKSYRYLLIDLSPTPTQIHKYFQIRL